MPGPGRGRAGEGCHGRKRRGSGPRARAGTCAVTGALANPAAQACAFVLGCAVIHAARAHAEVLTRLLVAVAIGTTVLLLLAASLTYAPGPDGSFDEVTVYADP